MDARRVVRVGPVARPLTDPVTTVETTELRRTSGRFRALGETTILGITPDILALRQAKGGTLR
jgi:hypothetical protein